ncbi:peptidoglycan-binding domain-containing protein [Candidatus Nitronereus thalassa]|uniref:Peptidoglycan-binding domain-containing protein n=1 Tax=Candidatus Nitronereus thalassa TaxID=3020898 RepID=A0ABU3K3S8_9BACT|nr:peptidoglycan-binding domain-containing protein [Candidatus Nitronereus thalassa]MDT7041019.1 peptidoglycan-binding domain-containing protein [Candidatus Nitronereus thalassa]
MRRSFLVIGILFVFSLSSTALAETAKPNHGKHAEDPSKPSIKAGTSQTSNQQSEEAKELEKLKPEEYRLLVLGTQIYLGRFGYGVGPFTGELDQQTQKALREYQKNVGIAETGTINKETLKHLTDDNNTLDQILPFIPKFNFKDEHWPETVSAHGTWAVENLPVAEALQTSQISCHRKWNLCAVSTAKLSPGYTPTLLSYTNIYEVETWNDTDIITKPSKTGTCVSTILQIRKEENSVTRLTSFERSNDGPCATVTARDIPMQLADGSQIYLALKQQKTQDSQRILRVKHSTGKSENSQNP